jgi:hypothetical protein
LCRPRKDAHATELFCGLEGWLRRKQVGVVNNSFPSSVWERHYYYAKLRLGNLQLPIIIR